MPRILILASISKAFRNFSFELLEAMRGEEWDVVISIPGDPVNADFESIGCRVIPSPLNRHGMNPLAELRLTGEYRKLCKTLKPDFILTYTIKPNTYGGMTARFFRIPYLSTVTGLGTVFFNDSLPYRMIRQMLKYGLRGADCLVFQNEHNRKLLKDSGFVKGRSRLVSGSGVNLEKHSLLPYPAEDGRIRFLMAARAQKEKGVAEYIEAAERILAEHPECEFHFAGLAEEEKYVNMIRKAAEKHIIIDHGFLKFEEMRECLKHIHAAVLPTYHEGMSNVLLESAAAGRPVLATDIPGCRETVNGKSGILFAPQSADALYNALKQFLTLSHGERESMGREGRNHVAANFDRKLVVAAYMEEIKKHVV